MIIDLTLGFNEIDLFLIRYHELKDLVDRFVVFEATNTFTGIPKELYFSDWYSDAFNERITTDVDLAKIDIMVWDNGMQFAPCIPDYAWVRDNTQRGLLGSWILENTQPDDIILFSDMDEIPNADTLRTFLNEHDRIDGIWRLEQDLCYLYFNTYAGKWCGTKIFHPTMVKSDVNMAEQMNSIRYISDDNVSGTIKNGGFHFSSQGGLEKIKQKFRSYAHYELSSKPDAELIMNLHDATDPFHNNKLTIIDIDTLPQFVQNNLEYFKNKGYLYGF